MALVVGGGGDVEAGGFTSRPFGVNLEQLNLLNEEKDMGALANMGGVEGLCKALHTSAHDGLDPDQPISANLAARREEFGSNKLPEAEAESFFMLMLDALKDPIILLLIAAATISTVLGAAIPEQRAKNEWIEGVAIWVAVILVSVVGAANDYQKDQQFRKLNAQKDAIDIKTVRAGQRVMVSNVDIVVGDVILLDAGDKIIADCIVCGDVQGLVLDEASLTGESDPVKKTIEGDPWVRSGTQVSEGSAKAVVVAVGVNSEWGKTMALMSDAGDEQTPLQEKLEGLAKAIGQVGLAVAVACFVAMLIKWCVAHKGFPIKEINNNGPIQFFLYAITIIVVAVPEGLPLAVTISLAYSMKKMLVDQNFVRHLAACETMGGATAICSDKTGTLTENRMTVVEGWFAGQKMNRVPAPSELSPDVMSALKVNMAMNSKAFLVDTGSTRVGYVGSSTECAMLMLLRGWGVEYDDVRRELEGDVVKLNGFNSARKMSSVVMRHDGKFRLYNKGAAEWVLKRCNRVYDAQGNVVQMTPQAQEELLATVTGMAKRGLRCICLTYTDYGADKSEAFFEDPDKTDQDLVALAIVGIKDPVRAEVPDAVDTCKKAGIVVRMVTGDNIHTAQHIARECGILFDDEHMAMEGPQFRQLHADSYQELQEMLPRIRVLARSSPEDKLTLVKMLKDMDEVVAVTGDGTNDAPALKESHVGLAMGIAGTEVAKEAADIIILDDNFSSIVKSVLWGRSIFNNIRKFLQFQLTVNCSALIICFIGAVVDGVEALNVLQLLWVNLIMDTMGALALATEAPSIELLKQKPHGKSESLISVKMWKHILVQGLYQVFVMLFCLFALPKIAPRYYVTTEAEYYQQECVSDVVSHLSIQAGNGSYNAGAPDATWYCETMQYCGFPLGADTANTPACPLQPLWVPAQVPEVQVDALCFNPPNPLGQDCIVNQNYSSARDYVSKQFDTRQEEDKEDSLSVLFNAFIWCQIFNEINSRRINDEYDFFVGLHKSPIFVLVILATIGLQVLIMEAIGFFFKVHGLDWKEWLGCIAAGFGSSILSWLTRWISRNIAFDIFSFRKSWRKSKKTSSGKTLGKSSLDPKELTLSVNNHRDDEILEMPVLMSNRTTSGRTASGRPYGTGSGRQRSGKNTADWREA